MDNRTFEQKVESEEWGGWEIISDMLDNPDELGIYNTSKCYEELHDFVVQHKQNLLNAIKDEIKKSMPEIIEGKTYSEEHPDIIKIKVLNDVIEMISNK